MSFPIVSEARIRAAVTAASAVAAIREAFRADGEGRTIVPPVINLAMPDGRGEFHVKTAYVGGLSRLAVKVASGFPDNPMRDLPSGSGLMAVFDTRTGLPSALLLDNGYLTDLRTGAAGAVAADYLAPRDVRTVGVIGSGVQARHQVVCLQAVRSFERLIAWSRSPSRLEAYVVEMQQRLGIEVSAAADPELVCRSADILITTTPSRAPIVAAHWLRPGVHVTAVGADSPGKQELDQSCITSANLIVVDRLSQCLTFGEIAAAHAAGLISEADIHAQLGEIVAGKKAGRARADQTTLCDLTGVGFQDTAIASLVLEALDSSTGSRIH
jgi:ectoine utilization protein EutC